MQIFLTLHSRFSSGYKRRIQQSAFTLVELLVTVSIIAVIASVVLVRFVDFDSSTILRSLAYEVATSIREAQVISLGTQGDVGSATFDVAYGVTFKPQTRQYTLFRYTGSQDPPNFKDTGFVDVVNTTNIGRSLQVSDVCLEDNDSTHCSADGISQVDISFIRPDFDALIRVHDAPVGLTISEISFAYIEVSSTLGNNVWIIEIGRLGSVSVYKQ